jgi:two-component system, LytTR family, response regulator
MTIKVFVVDDERLARVALKQLLQEHGDVELLGEASSVASARDALTRVKPEVVFLDIELGDGTGFELLSAHTPWRAVFCTAWENFALRAFEVNAIDYLVKPATPETVARALQRLSTPTPSVRLKNDDAVALREAYSMRLVPVGKIACVKAADDYSEVHVDGEPMALVEVTLKEWEARLADTSFIRIHRSALVNLSHVATFQLQQGRWEVTLRNGMVLEVSRRLAADVRRRLKAL